MKEAGAIATPDLAPLAGCVAVVTGAGAGIGAELSRQLALAGLRVVLADVNGDAVEAQASTIRASGGLCMAQHVDVADAQATQDLAITVQRDFGPVRLLINNAGVEALGRIWDMPSGAWDRIMRINLDGPVNMIRACLPQMAAAGERSYIANICSIGALISLPVQGAYVTSKHALLALTECLWLDVKDAGYPISVSAVLPGPVRTGIFDSASGNADQLSALHRRLMQDMLEAQGMAVDEAATQIISGIVAGDFWVSSHPEAMLFAARERASHLARLGFPEGPAFQAPLRTEKQ